VPFSAADVLTMLPMFETLHVQAYLILIVFVILSNVILDPTYYFGSLVICILTAFTSSSRYRADTDVNDTTLTLLQLLVLSFLT